MGSPYPYPEYISSSHACIDSKVPKPAKRMAGPPTKAVILQGRQPNYNNLIFVNMHIDNNFFFFSKFAKLAISQPLFIEESSVNKKSGRFGCEVKFNQHVNMHLTVVYLLNKLTCQTCNIINVFSRTSSLKINNGYLVHEGCFTEEQRISKNASAQELI